MSNVNNLKQIYSIIQQTYLLDIYTLEKLYRMTVCIDVMKQNLCFKIGQKLN